MIDVKKLANIRRFKSAPLCLKKGESTTPLSIDTEKGIIRNVVMCQVGEAKGHGVFLEQSFIDDLVAYDQKHFAEGLKARFDHPALCDGTMGTQLGKFQNFQVVGDKAVADLHLLEAANASPKHPQMRDWTLKMAEESPDFLMSSIVFAAGGAYQYDEKGDRVVLWTKNAKGDREWKNDYNESYGNVNLEMGDHFYTDLVEAGAATDALFSEQFNEDKFGIRAVEFFNDNEDVLAFLRSSPSKITEFLSKLNIEIPNEAAVALATAETRIIEIEGERDNYKESEVALKSDLEKATSRITELQAEVAELKEKPAGQFAGGESGGDNAEDKQNQELSGFGASLKAYAKSRQ